MVYDLHYIWLDNFVNFPFKVLQSYSKELSNIDTKYENNKNNLHIDPGLNMTGKTIKENLVKTLTNNEVKDMKVIKPLENRGILLRKSYCYYKNYY